MARVRSLPPGLRRLVRIGGGVIVVGAVVATVGGAPFLRGLTAITPLPVSIAVVLTGVATASAAWRWRVVAAGFGLELSWPGAVAAYYRSQFLNTILPGGVAGDVHRAYRHGRRSGDVALAARAVATERVAGQVVQFAVVVVVFASLGLSSPLREFAWLIGAVVALAAVVVLIIAVPVRGRRFLRREVGILSHVFRDPRRSLQVVASSILMIASHTIVFVVACLAAGVRAPLPELVALTLVVLTIGALPINVGGWGPREGAAAAAFAAVGLGAGAGVAASTTFGVLAMIALLPGSVVLVVARARAAREVRRAGTSRQPEQQITEPMIEEVNA